MRGAIQPIDCILFALWSWSCSLSLQCDSAFSGEVLPGHTGLDNENENQNDKKMHALDWWNKRGRILRGAFQPIEGVHFCRSRFDLQPISRNAGINPFWN